MRVRVRKTALTSIQQANWSQGLKDAKLCAEYQNQSEGLDRLLGCWQLRRESMQFDMLGQGFQIDLRRAMVEEFLRVRELSR